MQYLREVNPLYQVSYHQFEQLYDSAIAHSERWGRVVQKDWIFQLLEKTVLISSSSDWIFFLENEKFGLENWKKIIIFFFKGEIDFCGFTYRN